MKNPVTVNQVERKNYHTISKIPEIILTCKNPATSYTMVLARYHTSDRGSSDLSHSWHLEDLVNANFENCVVTSRTELTLTFGTC